MAVGMITPNRTTAAAIETTRELMPAKTLV